MQFFRLKMAKSKGKWQWYRLGHNPGLVRILTGKQTRCVSHLAMQLVEKSPKDEIRKSEGKVSRGRRPLATIKNSYGCSSTPRARRRGRLNKSTHYAWEQNGFHCV